MVLCGFFALWLYYQVFFVASCGAYTHIRQGCCTGTEAIGWHLPLYQWRYGRIVQFHKSKNALVSYPTMRHSEQKCARTFLFWMERCGIWNRCILGFVNKVNWLVPNYTTTQKVHISWEAMHIDIHMACQQALQQYINTPVMGYYE